MLPGSLAPASSLPFAPSRAVGLCGLSLCPHPRAVLGCSPSRRLQGGQGLRDAQDHHAEQCLGQADTSNTHFLNSQRHCNEAVPKTKTFL